VSGRMDGEERAMMRFWDGFIRIMDLASALCVVAMVGVVAVQILLRYVFGNPLVWADELASWLFVWVIYLGASVLVRYDAHLTVEIVTDRLSPRVNQWRRLLVNILVLSFLILLLVQTIELLQKFGPTLSPAMHVPMGFFFGCGMIFATIGVIEYLRQTVCLVLVLCGRMTEVVVQGPDGKDLKKSVKL
jgi:TRAP-type C4-dicarboxylate transport system permease small subunit